MKRYLCSVPAVLSGLPVGPLYPHIASFVQGLGPQGYSSCAINQKIRLLRRLDEWFVHRHIGIGSFDDALIERFLCLRRKGGHVQLGDPTTLRSFLNHLREHGVVPRSSAKPDNIQGHQLLTSFAQYLTEERGLARATLKRYLCDTKKFISERFRSSSISLRDLHPHDIARFVIGRGTVVSSSAAQHAVSPLRALLKFLQQRGDVTANLAASVPSVAKWSLAGLPKYLQSHEVERLLGTCKGSNAGERRDRAILLLLARRSPALLPLQVPNRRSTSWDCRYFGSPARLHFATLGTDAARFAVTSPRCWRNLSSARSGLTACCAALELTTVPRPITNRAISCGCKSLSEMEELLKRSDMNFFVSQRYRLSVARARPRSSVRYCAKLVNSW